MSLFGAAGDGGSTPAYPGLTNCSMLLFAGLMTRLDRLIIAVSQKVLVAHRIEPADVKGKERVSSARARYLYDGVEREHFVRPWLRVFSTPGRPCQSEDRGNCTRQRCKFDCFAKEATRWLYTCVTSPVVKFDVKSDIATDPTLRIVPTNVNKFLINFGPRLNALCSVPRHCDTTR